MTREGVGKVRWLRLVGKGFTAGQREWQECGSDQHKTNSQRASGGQDENGTDPVIRSGNVDKGREKRDSL